jgi:hypothetical protein
LRPSGAAALHRRRRPGRGARPKDAIAVISSHHNLLLALPGRGARRTESDRRRLAELLATINEDRA